MLLLHGFGDTGDMWAPLAARLVKDHTVVVPDLRGMGLSSHPEAGYDKKNEAQDIAAVLLRSRSTARSPWSRTISAIWSAMPSPPRTATGSHAGW